MKASARSSQITQPISTLTTPGKASLMMIEGQGLMPGMSYYLNAKRHAVGRTHGVILVEDPHVSPSHGSFHYDADGQLFVDDEGSHNGVFLRLRDVHTLRSGDRFLIGHQIYQFDQIDEASQVDAYGTRAYGSPRKDMRLRILHILDGGLPGKAWAMEAREVSFGREGCTVDLSQEPHASRRHARIILRGDDFVLEDLSSTNGTFLCVRGPKRLHHGDDLILGRQRMRVQINP